MLEEFEKEVDDMTAKTSFKRRFIRPEMRVQLIVGILLVAGAILVPTIAGNAFWQQAMLVAAVYVIAAIGLDVLRAQAQQMSFGQGAVLGVAAYVTALANGAWDLSFGVSALLGLLSGTVFGILMSLPSLRVQGFYLGFVTLAGALALPNVIVTFKDQTHALTGVNVFPSGINETIVGSLDWLTLIVIVVAIVFLIGAAALQSSGWGRAMRMAGESPEAASTLGLSSGRLRLEGFAIASVAASIAGILYVAVIQYVGSGSFTLALSVMLYFVVLIGGPGKVLGPILGVGLLYVVPDHVLTSFIDFRMLIYGLLVIVVIYLMPEGIANGLSDVWKRWFKRGEEKRGLIALEPILKAANDGVVVSKREQDAPILVVDQISRSFGSVKALDGASITVDRGTLHAIVGPNGSGKTTLLNAVSGLISVDDGRMEFDGHDLTRMSASARARLGLARTFQSPRLLDSMSVWENIDCGKGSKYKIEWLEKALNEVRDEWDATRCDVLPHGQRRFLEVLRALYMGPQLIALDEPAAGLSLAERLEFGELLREIISTTDVTVLLVEHDLELVWRIADKISVVDNGRVIASGTPAELRNSQAIAHLFVGVDHVAN